MKLRKITQLLLTAVILVYAFTGCEKTTAYKVTVDNEHTSICEVGESYSEGEEVVVRLPTYTEHYYSLYVNGTEQQMDDERSDMNGTYFVFTMPGCDVYIKIEDHSVDIPSSPQTLP